MGPTRPAIRARPEPAGRMAPMAPTEPQRPRMEVRDSPGRPEPTVARVIPLRPGTALRVHRAPRFQRQAASTVATVELRRQETAAQEVPADVAATAATVLLLERPVLPV